MRAPVTTDELRECPGCGLFQRVPALASDMAATCDRCHTTLRRTRRRTLERGLALNIAATFLLVILCLENLMAVEKAGITLHAGLFSGPAELVRRQMAILAVAVVLTTVIAPFGKLLGTIYVLARLRRPAPPRHLATVWGLVERITPWSMFDVFLFGVFVAYVKLGDIVHLDLEVGVYSLLALTFVQVWADSVLDRHAVWDAIGDVEAARGDPVPRHDAPVPATIDPRRAIGCDTCALVCDAPAGGECPRCGARLRVRKPDPIARTWALLIAAIVLYVPANYFPVLTVVQLGAGAPSTIIGGVVELVNARQYPLAALVLFASVLVPLLKMGGLGGMLLLMHFGRIANLRARTRLYHIIEWIGRWSMIDIFMESLLGALVKFGAVVTITPGMGAIAFCAVVFLTMFAAASFDPRVMWDAAERRAAPRQRRAFGRRRSGPGAYSTG